MRSYGMVIEMNDTKATQLRAFQRDILNLVKLYAGNGVSYHDLMALVINLAAVMAETSKMSLTQTIRLWEHAYQACKLRKRDELN